MRLLKFNGMKKNYVTVIRGRRRPTWAPMERNLLTVMGMPGAHLTYSRAKTRIIDVPVFIKANDFTDLQKIKEDVAEWLVHDEPKELIFEDEPDRVYFALVDESLVLDELVRVGQGVITFICPDPYKYGPERTAIFPADAVNLKNEGTVEADPIFEMTAKKKTTFAMISNGEEYNLIGKPADVDETLIDEKTKILDEIGDTLSDWQTQPDSTGSFVKGSLGIQVQSYGTGTAWHGPKLMKEITPTDDFEIEMFVNVRSETPEQTFRISTNYYDENMNELGMLRMWDNSDRILRKVVEARIGPYIDKNVNYLISQQNYDLRDQRVWNGLLRVKRVGKEFTFYAARISQAGNHIEHITQRFIDQNNEYAGKLKFIQIDIANFGTTATANEIGINRVLVHRHNKVLVDQTPYILNAGDVVTFDHKDDDILINGEPRNDLKNFGGSFFTLKKGANTLVVSPDDSFDVRCRYRERFR